MNDIKYSSFIFLGACSYGILASIVKLALNTGLPVYQVTGSQYLLGFLLLLAAIPFIRRKKVTLKQASGLMLTGASLSLTGIMYGLSLNINSAAIAVVLLFQFTWIGILLECLWIKKLPSKMKVISMILLIIGTLFASNVISEGIDSIPLDGFIYGILSAVAFAVFIFSSGKVAVGIPSIQRSVFISLGGALLIVFCFGHEVVATGLEWKELWKYAMLTSLFGVVFPVILFAIGTPKIESGLATIVGSAELPAAIIAAVIILGEKITSGQLIGIGLILIGIVLPQVSLFFIKEKPKDNSLTV